MWDQLTPEEQHILAPKLLDGPALDASVQIDLNSLGETFKLAIFDSHAQPPPLSARLLARLLTLRNFVRQTGGTENSDLWRQIVRIKGVRESYLELTVADRDELLRILASSGFIVNREPFWTIHKFDSARAMTRYSDQPSLHFANDRLDEPAYGPNYFFVHWDSSSVWFQKSLWWGRRIPGAKTMERLVAAWQHRSGFASPEAVSWYLTAERARSETVEV